MKILRPALAFEQTDQRPLVESGLLRRQRTVELASHHSSQIEVGRVGQDSVTPIHAAGSPVNEQVIHDCTVKRRQVQGKVKYYVNMSNKQ